MQPTKVPPYLQERLQDFTCEKVENAGGTPGYTIYKTNLGRSGPFSLYDGEALALWTNIGKALGPEYTDTSPAQPSQCLQSVADALTIEQLNDKVERLMAVQPSQAGELLDHEQKAEIVSNWFSDEDMQSRAMQMLGDIGNHFPQHPAQRSSAMPEYETRTTSMTIVPKGEPLFSEQATQVTTVDEAGGEFVEVCQSGSIGLGKIAINPEEWPALRDAISLMIENCREQTE